MKEKLFLLPGTLCNRRLFDPIIETLSHHFDPFTVDIGLDDDVEDIADKVATLSSHSFSILGLSYGGIICFELWRRHASKINRMILLNTTHKLPTNQTREKLEFFLKLSSTDNFESITRDYLKDTMLHPSNAKIHSLRKTILDMAIETGKEKFYRQVKAQLHRKDSTTLLSTITCPTLIICGEDDKVCPPSLHIEMNEHIRNSTLHIIPNCGHLSTLESPESVSNQILSWYQ